MKVTKPTSDTARLGAHLRLPQQYCNLPSRDDTFFLFIFRTCLHGGPPLAVATLENKLPVIVVLHVYVCVVRACVRVVMPFVMHCVAVMINYLSIYRCKYIPPSVSMYI